MCIREPIEIRVRTLVFANLKNDKERSKEKNDIRKHLVGHCLIDNERIAMNNLTPSAKEMKSGGENSKRIFSFVVHCCISFNRIYNFLVALARLVNCEVSVTFSASYVSRLCISVRFAYDGVSTKMHLSVFRFELSRSLAQHWKSILSYLKSNRTSFGSFGANYIQFSTYGTTTIYVCRFQTKTLFSF